MANFHARSNSFPSQSHPMVESVEDQLCRLNSSGATSTSTSSTCANLDGIRNLHEASEFVNEVLQGSLRLVDLCQFSRDIVRLTKESVQDLESSIRRNKGETVSVIDIDCYVASRNKIKKMINKTVLKEADAHTLLTLKSVLMLMSGEKESSNQRNWSLLSKFVKTIKPENCVEELCSVDIPKSKKGMDCITSENMLKELRASEMTIQELDEGLEALFRNLIKTRVSLLNVLSN
ncbi:uncharacterized protein LOC127246561 [Andrographis paniculata]|uniref:uncharacterized protein LOC127246561 n=1 Tax=Andrographis paniculata TaxID=175694 RepID=UPI0021E8FFEC|nr:uncharacterized protein LOC127246561 [Andrographis paniculata]